MIAICFTRMAPRTQSEGCESGQVRAALERPYASWLRAARTMREGRLCARPGRLRPRVRSENSDLARAGCADTSVTFGPFGTCSDAPRRVVRPRFLGRGLEFKFKFEIQLRHGFFLPNIVDRSAAVDIEQGIAPVSDGSGPHRTTATEHNNVQLRHGPHEARPRRAQPIARLRNSAGLGEWCAHHRHS